MLYLAEAEKEDKEITENWKGDTEGILVFTGLFSATVATFIIESYKQLSLDSGATTNALLTQISQQLANTSNGTPFPGVGAQNSPPFKPTASAVRVNVMWFLSLVLSLTCALSATLMQQWARQYQELARRRGAPHKHARMRAYIFDGIKGFRMTRAIEAMPMLLHLSVFLFFAGLIDFLILINTTVAYFTLGWIALFALAYVILTILPNLYLNCPYRTPLSGITWRLSQFSVLIILLAIRGVEGLFHGSLLSLWHWTHQQVTGTTGPTKWRETLKMQVAMRRKWLSDGLRKSVELLFRLIGLAKALWDAQPRVQPPLAPYHPNSFGVFVATHWYDGSAGFSRPELHSVVSPASREIFLDKPITSSNLHARAQ
ncbi:hypothetical protein EDB84DRAFT_113234 [Lactarius hengduanensis]|nr:hypothetical protein EDB84DRAFT_113234 [Lactarius hengduanensis]